MLQVPTPAAPSPELFRAARSPLDGPRGNLRLQGLAGEMPLPVAIVGIRCFAFNTVASSAQRPLQLLLLFARPSNATRSLLAWSLLPRPLPALALALCPCPAAALAAVSCGSGVSCCARNLKLPSSMGACADPGRAATAPSPPPAAAALPSPPVVRESSALPSSGARGNLTLDTGNCDAPVPSLENPKLSPLPRPRKPLKVPARVRT